MCDEKDRPPIISDEGPNTEEITENPTRDAGEETTSAEEEIELPSNVRNRNQIFIPLDLKSDDPRIYGKWMWFSNGDLYLQDEMWIRLAKLILEGLVILMESSTARKCKDRGRHQGVIKCYTSGGIDNIKSAGIAIQNIAQDDVILHYKSNQASKDSLSRSYGDRFISQYMLTVSGGFYEKDELDRWKRVKDDNQKENSSQSCVQQIYLPPHKRRQLLGSEMLPSQENNKVKLHFPIHEYINSSDGKWCLFCNITDFDKNGMTELDRTWIGARKLCDEGVFSLSVCETIAFNPNPLDSPLRRSINCVLRNHSDIARVIESGDKLRERTGHNFPIYFKVIKEGHSEVKLKFSIKYLFTENRELYEHVNQHWKLIVKSV